MVTAALDESMTLLKAASCEATLNYQASANFRRVFTGIGEEQGRVDVPKSLL